MWYQLTIKGCASNLADAFSEHLQELGAVSVTLLDEADSPVLEPAPGATPLWPDVIIQALFDDEDIQQAALHALKTSHPHCEVIPTELEDQDWERAWMQDFHPMQFGERVWVCPSWTPPPQPDAINLMLDPGLAFGSGTHPTTALCLEYLDKHPPLGKSVIDFGCGSGILAIAALKLGASHVCAVDIDEQALQATKANAKNNGIVADTLSIGFPDSLTEKVDYLLANILAKPLVELKSQFQKLLNDQGVLILSGLLTEQIDWLLDEYTEGFTLVEKKVKDEWGLLVFQKTKTITRKQ